MALEYRFRIVDFRPAPEGWRIAWITKDGLEVTPMPGWAVREEFEYDGPNSDDGRSTGSRDVVACRIDETVAEPLDYSTDTGFWFLLGPGERKPTAEEVEAEVDRRAKGIR